MKKMSLCVATLLFAACASSKKKSNVPPPVDAKAQAEFDHGLNALDAEDYATAAKIFDSLLLEKPGTSMELVTLFNSGSAYEGLGQCDKAADRYRQVVRSSANKFKRIEGEALFRLSLAYECMGQDAKTITALLDAKRRGKDLAFETINAEIPARMAAAYSRLGNRTQAMEYFNLASRGLKALVNKGNVRARMEIITRTLYVMGRLNATQRKAEVDGNSFLLSLSIQQPYLLQAMEMNRDPWSSRAAEDLRMAYSNIWLFKLSGDRQREFYTRGLQVINELRKIRMPGKADPKEDDIFALLDKTENRLQRELSEVAETTKLTPEARKREGLKREGRLVNPKSADKTERQ